MSIYQATLIRCIEEQGEAYQHAGNAQSYLEQGRLGPAALEQQQAALHHDEVWCRLAQLLGTA